MLTGTSNTNQERNKIAYLYIKSIFINKNIFKIYLKYT
jgi:hypothetical protein